MLQLVWARLCLAASKPPLWPPPPTKCKDTACTIPSLVHISSFAQDWVSDDARGRTWPQTHSRLRGEPLINVLPCATQRPTAVHGGRVLRSRVGGKHAQCARFLISAIVIIDLGSTSSAHRDLPAFKGAAGCFCAAAPSGSRALRFVLSDAFISFALSTPAFTLRQALC